MKLQKLLSKAIYAPLMALTSCATIINGTTQSINIASNPTKANVFVDNMLVGDTPIIVHLTRRDNHLVRIELNGYMPYEAAFTRELSGWVFGNILFGGFIGLAVDAVTGAIYRLTPENIQAEMKQANICYSKKTEDSTILIVLNPNPSWEKIGDLTPAAS